jgi:hypothetical protein
MQAYPTIRRDQAPTGAPPRCLADWRHHPSGGATTAHRRLAKGCVLSDDRRPDPHRLQPMPKSRDRGPCPERRPRLRQRRGNRPPRRSTGDCLTDIQAAMVDFAARQAERAAQRTSACNTSSRRSFRSSSRRGLPPSRYASTATGTAVRSSRSSAATLREEVARVSRNVRRHSS